MKNKKKNTNKPKKKKLDLKSRKEPIGNFSPIFPENSDSNNIIGTEKNIVPVEIDVIKPKSKWRKLLDFLRNLF